MEAGEAREDVGRGLEEVQNLDGRVGGARREQFEGR